MHWVENAAEATYVNWTCCQVAERVCGKTNALTWCIILVGTSGKMAVCCKKADIDFGRRHVWWEMLWRLSITHLVSWDLHETQSTYKRDLVKLKWHSHFQDIQYEKLTLTEAQANVLRKTRKHFSNMINYLCRCKISKGSDKITKSKNIVRNEALWQL